MPLPSGRYRLRRLTPCAWPDAADPPARSCAAVLALAARPTFPRVGTASGLPQSMHSPISHHRAASACMRGVRLGVARNQPGCTGTDLRGKDAWQTRMSGPPIVCHTGIRHGRDRGRIIKPADRPLMRFLSLSALSGRGALDRRCQLRTGAASALAMGVADRNVCPTWPRPCGFPLLGTREQFSPARGDRESSRDTCQP
jgi:hypothetical protein